MNLLVEEKLRGFHPDKSLTDCAAARGFATLDDSILGSLMCGTPDHADPELAAYDPQQLAHDIGVDFGEFEQYCCDVPELHAARLEAQRAIGQGGWPGGNVCHPDLYPHANYHATTIFFEYDQFLRHSDMRRAVTDSEWETVIAAKVWPSVENPVKTVAECKATFVHTEENRAKGCGQKVGDTYNVLAMGIWLALEATRRAGCLLIEVFDGTAGTKHRIHVKMIPIPGSTAGYAYFPNGTCTSHVTCNIDSLDPYSLDWFARLLTHELGHNLRLEHEFRSPQSAHRSVMSYATVAPFQGYRLSGAPYQYVEDHSWPVLRSYYGGEPAMPITPVEPPTQPRDFPFSFDIGSAGAICEGKIKLADPAGNIVSGRTTVNLAGREAWVSVQTKE